MIKTNIVLVALFDLTETYWQIAQKFSDVMNVYYVTSTQVTFNWLVTNGVEKACILDLSQTRRQVRALGEASQELLSQIRDFERFGPTFTSIIMMSRFYRGEDSDCLIHYMGQTALRLEEFFLCNNIEWVLAEPTNAVELLAYQVCKKHNIAVGQLCFPVYRRAELFYSRTSLSKSITRCCRLQMQKVRQHPVYVKLLRLG
jgi:hypothetical protein